MTTITFAIKYHYGDAEQGRLDMYDAAVSFQGFAKALSITAHALLNDGEIRRKGHRLEGGELYINPSRKGSFEQIVTFVITNKEAIGASIAAAAFYDLIKWTWSKTLDLAYEPETPHVKKLAERIEPFLGEMEEALEIPLEQAHRPIKKNPEMVIALKRQRVGEVIRLDAETLQNVSLQTESQVTENIKGNVTRYNILSGYGRFYDDSLGKTISFKVEDDVSSTQKQLLTWSLHFAQETEGAGKILIDAKRILTAKGIVKRYIVSNIQQA
ncbi:hypothetical protein L2728_19150 [Shewanella chilikensis]|uniref:DUF7946 domain-containing protein n=2 Tax=Shewanellaceae TaxID=267890 RepID=UPI001BEFB1DA|nr:hypothetical protein [Shewanella chilikensis]MCL1163966.1 hypothetical protein [Shewanella chilikensis]BCV65922.1 hypothetical protein TUM17387_12810 [Shewanella carassii]